MAVCKILRQPAPILHQVSVLVNPLGEARTIKNLRDTLLATYGAAGIAAPQIGLNKRIIAMRSGDILRVMCNPVITWFSKNVDIEAEGCLSVKGMRRIQRPVDITVVWQTPEGLSMEKDFSGFPARIIQHEVDHLNGITIADYV